MSRRTRNKPTGGRRPPAGCGPLASRGSSPPQPAWLPFAVCLALCLAVWVVFGQTLHHDFVDYDDNAYVYENPAVSRGLSWDGALWAFTHRQDVNWHPLTTMSHMLDCRLYGLQPGGHHLTSVLVHAAAALLLFLVLRSLTGALWRSAFVAAVFAVHPLRVESVAWVAERKDVLSGLFFMLTLWAWARYARRLPKPERPEQKLPFKPAAADYVLALVFFSMGLLSKPMLVTLPFVLLLLDWWPLRRFTLAAKAGPSLRRVLLEKIPFLLLSAAACAATVQSQKNVIRAADYLEFPWRAANALVSYAAYLWQMLYPAGLAVFYPHPGSHLSLGAVGLSLLVVLLVSAGVLALRRTQPYLLVGWLWYLGMLVPVIGLVQVGIQARADRYTYLPQIGLSVMVAWGATQLCRGWRHRRLVLGSAAAAVLAALLATAYEQTGYWKDSITLWTHALSCTSGNYVAHYNLGNELDRQGKLPEAMQHYEQALRFNPAYADAHNNVGNLLASQGKVKEAIQHYEQALQYKPHDAETHNNFGMALLRQGNAPEAIRHFKQALQLKPDFADAYNNLGLALASQGNFTEAVRHYEQALQLKPDFAQARNNLGLALASQGNVPEAVRHFEQALQLKPDFADAHNNLGLALLYQDNAPKAIRQFEQALQLKPDFADAHNNLGMALASQGNLPEAIRHFKRALQLKPDDAKARANLEKALASQGK